MDKDLNNLKVGIVIPWRPEPSRVVAFNFVVSFYRNYFPDMKLYISDCKSEPWIAAEARNLGTEAAIADNCDVIVAADADHIVRKKAFKKAILMSHKLQIATQPFYRHFKLNESLTNKLMKNTISRKEIRKKAEYSDRVPGGVLIYTPDVFETLNGFDERFDGYGGEDVGFNVAHKTIYGVELLRIDSEGLSLWHESSKYRTSEMLLSYEKNERELQKFYYPAEGNIEMMKEVISRNRINRLGVKEW